MQRYSRAAGWPMDLFVAVLEAVLQVVAEWHTLKVEAHARTVLR